MSHVDFSSWPREQEASFVVYEQHNSDSNRRALTLGGIAGALVLVFLLVIYAVIPPDSRDMTKGMNMDNLSNRPAETAK